MAGSAVGVPGYSRQASAAASIAFCRRFVTIEAIHAALTKPPIKSTGVGLEISRAVAMTRQGRSVTCQDREKIERV
jgi:hypothetical protein